MPASSGYKPSPLGYGSPRSSPFRRPESPASPSPLRQTTPTTSPLKMANVGSNGRFSVSPTPSSRTLRGNADEMPSSSSSSSSSSSPSSPQATRSSVSKPTAGSGNALSQLQPAQVRTMREGFQILDRDNDGIVNREDVADMLSQLGLPSSQSDVSQFFPPSAPQTMTLPVFLNSIATSLAQMSPSTELLAALSAFDDDDSGQIDLAELRDALLHTAPEAGEEPLTASDIDKVINGFTGRKAFSKANAGGMGKRGEVFKYQDFVTSIFGGNGNSEQASSEDAEEEA